MAASESQNGGDLGAVGRGRVCVHCVHVHVTCREFSDCWSVCSITHSARRRKAS